MGTLALLAQLANAPREPVGREADRAMLSQLPARADYAHWRYAVVANVVAASAKPDEAAGFTRDVDNPAVGDAAFFFNRPANMQTLDAKLYGAIVAALTNKPTDGTQRLLVNIRQHVALGCGRQALRVVDAYYMMEGPRKRQWVLHDLVNVRVVSSSEGIDPLLVKVGAVTAGATRHSRHAQ